MNQTLTDIAIDLLETRWWSMVPSTGREKKPCVAWMEFQKHLPTSEQLREWDREFKPERWGLVTGKVSGVVVIDFDGDQGRLLLQEWGLNPHVRTGSGGFHVYVKHPGWRVPTLNAKSSKNSWPWPGLDIRGDGGFAVLLGRNSNGPYEQLRELTPELFDVLPLEVRQFLKKHSQSTKALKSKPRARTIARPTGSPFDSSRLVDQALAMAPNGRNNAGFWLACQLRDNGYGLSDASSPMRDFQARVPRTNAKGQNEPYTWREACASLGEAYSRSPRNPWKEPNRVPRERPSVPPQEAAAPARLMVRREEQYGHEDNADSGNLTLYVGHTGEPLLGHMGEPLSSHGFARVPAEVLSDRLLKDRDTRVYAVLANACFQGRDVTLGKRRIAKLARCAERLVVESLRRLEDAGHIKKHPRRRGERGRYSLLSSIFDRRRNSAPDLQLTKPRGVLQIADRKDAQREVVSFPRSYTGFQSSEHPHRDLPTKRGSR